MFIEVTNLHSSKPKSRHVHVHFFAPWLIMHNEKKNQFYYTFQNLQMVTLQTSRLLTYLIFLAMWCKLKGHFGIFHIKRPMHLETLSSLVENWTTLFIVYPRHTPPNGVYKFNASHEIINFRAMIMLPKLVPSSFTYDKTLEMRQKFHAWFSIPLPTHAL
jgi:hypothetical protein